MHLIWLTSGNNGIQFTNIATDHETRNVEQAETGTQHTGGRGFYHGSR